jgi:multidrug efflux pump subunit AcrA (membrane-fusion protein)
VRTGATEQGMVEIVAGLNPGDRVAVSAVEQLQNGDRVSGAAHE